MLRIMVISASHAVKDEETSAIIRFVIGIDLAMRYTYSRILMGQRELIFPHVEYSPDTKSCSRTANT